MVRSSWVQVFFRSIGPDLEALIEGVFGFSNRAVEDNLVDAGGDILWPDVGTRHWEPPCKYVGLVGATPITATDASLAVIGPWTTSVP
jgi:hypothetical protein